MRQAEGVGPLTALTFVLTVEDPYRFEKGRSVGAYLGLVPAQDQSGERDPQKHITKEGDEMLRKLLVSGAQYILGSFGTLGHTETATSALTKCAFSWKFAPYKQPHATVKIAHLGVAPVLRRRDTWDAIASWGGDL